MNDEMTLSNYARSRGITAQAASQAFKRHQVDMIDMFKRRGKAIILTEEGAEYLDRVRAQLPTVAEPPETIQALKDRIQKLQQQHDDDVARIKELESRIDQKEQIIENQAQQILISSQQVLQISMSMKKKGIGQRIKEWFTGTPDQEGADEVR